MRTLPGCAGGFQRRNQAIISASVFTAAGSCTFWCFDLLREGHRAKTRLELEVDLNQKEIDAILKARGIDPKGPNGITVLAADQPGSMIGMDKIEITEQAQQIGSFTTSIEPDQDCCKLFVPLHPSTRTKPDDILRIERGLEISAFVKRGVEKAELTIFTFPS